MRTAIIIGSLCFLTGCDLPTLDLPVLAVAPTTYHDVRYYDAHPVERAQTKAWCDNNPAAYTGGMAAKYPSCDSAITSNIHAWHRKMGWE